MSEPSGYDGRVQAKAANPKPRGLGYFVDEGIPGWWESFTPGNSVQNVPSTLMEDLPNYHLIANGTDVTRSQYSGSSDGRHMSGTLVYDGKVYDHVEFENRGEASTYVSGKNKWRFHFNRARRFSPRDNWGKKSRQKWTKPNLQSLSSHSAAVNRATAGRDTPPTNNL